MKPTIVLTANTPNGRVITFNLYGEVSADRHIEETKILKHRVSMLS